MRIRVVNSATGEMHWLTKDRFRRYQRRNDVRQREDGAFEFFGPRHETRALEDARTPGRKTVHVTPMRAGGNKQSFEKGLPSGHRLWTLKGVLGRGR